MIKFFRRIRRKLIDEESTKKYLLYAIGEILLVMIGILLALQVNNWNETRKQLAQERQLLERLQTEMQTNQHLIQEELNNLRSVSQSTRMLLDAIGTNPKSYSRDSINLMMNGLSFTPKYSPNQGSLSSIISSGQITIISNESLNVKLTEWPGLLEDYNYTQRIFYDLSKKQWMEFMLNVYPIRDHQVETAFGTTGPSRFHYNQERILSTMTIETIAEFKRIDSENAHTKLKNLENLQTEILDLIKQELPK